MKRIILTVVLLAVSLLVLAFADKTAPAQDSEVLPPVQSEPAVLHWSEEPILKREDIEPGTSSPTGNLALKDVPARYTAWQAFKDGCYSGTQGASRYEDFLAASKEGKACSLRYVVDLTKQSIVCDVEFDGEKYIVREYKKDPEREGVEFEVNTSYRILTQEEMDEEGRPLDPLFNNYNDDPQAAIDDGCIFLDTQYGLSVIGYNHIEHGAELWDDFLSKVEAGEPARIRVCESWLKYYEDGTRSEDEVELDVWQLEFDGENFYVIDWSEYYNAEVCSRYSSMAVGTDKNLEKQEITVYILCHSDEYTWEEIDRRNEELMLSSSMFTFNLSTCLIFVK